MSWSLLIAAVRPHVVRISTPTGHGTGFLAFYGSQDRSICGIATAAHVVSHADEWQQPIKLLHDASGAQRMIRFEDRVIYLDHATDSAVVLCFKGDLNLPESPIALLQ